MQGVVWTRDYFHSMPIEGNSSFIDSIQNVHAIHTDVARRANAKFAKEGCIVPRHEYANQTTNDVMWDAFESDLKNSNIPASQRVPSPTNWPTCPTPTDCGACKACKKCEPCKGGGGKCKTKCTECAGCKACKQKAAAGCEDQVKSYNCGACMCDAKKGNCGECKSCTSAQKCLNFVPPMFNQQSMLFVVYLFTAYPVLFGKDLAISACEADLWAFNHLFAAVG